MSRQMRKEHLSSQTTDRRQMRQREDSQKTDRGQIVNIERTVRRQRGAGGDMCMGMHMSCAWRMMHMSKVIR
jgi:hypothetical protein